MNVRIGTSRVVGATDPYSELWVTVKPQENRTARGGSLYSSYNDQNTGRLQIQSLIPTAQRPFPTANVGDTLTGTTEGPLDFNQFGGYTLAARTLGTVKDNGLKREVTRKQRTGELAVATYNVENLDPSDPQSKFDALAQGVVTNLASPDIVALEEIQDNNGAKNDGTVDAVGDREEVHGRDHGGGRPGLPVALHRPGERQGRRRARRQHPPGLPVQPRRGSPSPTVPAATTRPPSASPAPRATPR